MTSSTAGDRRTHFRLGQRLLIDHRHVRDVDGGRAVLDGLAEPIAAGGELFGGRLRAGCAEAVEGRVAWQPDRVDAEQAGDRGDGRELCRSDLEAVVESVEEVHRRRGAEGEEVAGHERAVAQCRERRIDRVPPGERPELGPRQVHHPVPVGELVQSRRRRGPGRRGLLVTFQGRIDEPATGEHRQVAEGDEHDRGGEHGPAPGDRAPDGVDEGGAAEGQPDGQQRQGPGARAQRQGQPVLTIAAERLGDRGRIDERMDTDGEHEPGERDGDGEAARREAHDRQAAQGRRSRAETRR